MDLIESVMLSMLIALAGAALLAVRMGTERRDLGLLTALPCSGRERAMAMQMLCALRRGLRRLESRVRE